MATFAELSPAQRLRVRAHILDHLHDNNGNFAVEFRRAVIEQARAREISPHQAFDEALAVMHARVAIEVDRLPQLQTGTIGNDLRRVNDAFNAVRNTMVEEIQSGNFHDIRTGYRGRIERALEGNPQLLIPENRESNPMRLVELLRGRAGRFHAEFQQDHATMAQLYGENAAQAAERIQTRANSNIQEAQAIRTGIDSINDNYWNYPTHVVLQEARDAIRAISGSTRFSDADIDNLAQASVRLSTNRPPSPDR